MRYYNDFDLTNYNSFHVKSIAKEIWFPETIEELQSITIELKNRKFEILSGGTNVLLKSKIDRIICLKLMPKYINFLPIGIDISANYSTTAFVLQSIQKGIKGLEGLYGIPGTVGGGIVMNAGSGKYAISDYLVSVTILDISNGELYITDEKYLNFQRRYSILQDTKEIVISALFRFKIGEIDCVKLENIQKIKKYRYDFPKGYSAGGIFINWHDLKPYEKEIRTIKSPNLVISKQLNIIINNGKATSEEILDFINKIKVIVKKPLKLELKLLGF